MFVNYQVAFNYCTGGHLVVCGSNILVRITKNLGPFIALNQGLICNTNPLGEEEIINRPGVAGAVLQTLL